MTDLELLFKNNASWVSNKMAKDANYFTKIAKGQSPKYLYIGCSDSRIPVEQVLGLEPGEMFVHRNIANQFVHTDFNALSALQFAVEYLGVEHIIVCGHYNCGGIATAMETKQYGMIDNWLRHIKDIIAHEKHTLEKIADKKERYDRVVELNVLQQVLNICHTQIVQNAWLTGQSLSVHGLVFDLSTGHMKDLHCTFSSIEQIDPVYVTTP